MEKPSSEDRRKEPVPGAIRGEIIDEICKQIEKYLPVNSFNELAEKMSEIRVGSHSVPLRLIAPHVSRDAFPVEDAKDLKRKVSEGAARAVSLGRSPTFRASTNVFDRTVGDLTQVKARIGLRRPAVHRIYYPDLPD